MAFNETIHLTPKASRNGSVLIFVSMTFILIPEAGCGQSPQILVNTGNSGNGLCWKL